MSVCTHILHNIWQAQAMHITKHHLSENLMLGDHYFQSDTSQLFFFCCFRLLFFVLFCFFSLLCEYSAAQITPNTTDFSVEHSSGNVQQLVPQRLFEIWRSFLESSVFHLTVTDLQREKKKGRLYGFDSLVLSDSGKGPAALAMHNGLDEYTWAVPATNPPLMFFLCIPPDTLVRGLI